MGLDTAKIPGGQMHGMLLLAAHRANLICGAGGVAAATAESDGCEAHDWERGAAQTHAGQCHHPRLLPALARVPGAILLDTVALTMQAYHLLGLRRACSSRLRLNNSAAIIGTLPCLLFRRTGGATHGYCRLVFVRHPLMPCSPCVCRGMNRSHCHFVGQAFDWCSRTSLCGEEATSWQRIL